MNIMKLTDGLFHDVFDEVAKEYPEVEADHLIIDIGTARVAARPEDFDVIVTPNLYGDVLSDVVAEVSGSVGMAPSANIGSEAAVFEAIHGSAPDIAGKNIANPSGLILAAAKMLAHLGEGEHAELIHELELGVVHDRPVAAPFSEELFGLVDRAVAHDRVELGAVGAEGVLVLGEGHEFGVLLATRDARRLKEVHDHEPTSMVVEVELVALDEAGGSQQRRVRQESDDVLFPDVIPGRYRLSVTGCDGPGLEPVDLEVRHSEVHVVDLAR